MCIEQIMISCLLTLCGADAHDFIVHFFLNKKKSSL
jgi:hypothetical protein